jgi:hypothetical protein
MNRSANIGLDIKMRSHQWFRGFLIISVIMGVAETFAQNPTSYGGQKEEYLPVLEVQATRSNKKITDVPAARVGQTSAKFLMEIHNSPWMKV